MQHESHPSAAHHYWRLLSMLVLSAVAMYWLMYAMVNELGNVFMNANQLYMALLMTAPMAVIEIVLMRSMYTSKRLNVMVAVGTLILLLGSWMAIREQAAIGNAQFLRSMIPHHAGAILMCERADVSDAGIQALCRSIIESQQSEIDQMKAMLASTAR